MKRSLNPVEPPALSESAHRDRDLESPSKPVQAKNDHLKWIALMVLVLQNSGLILFMRFSRIQSAGEGERLYCISTAVAVSETSKLFLSSALLFVLDANLEPSTFMHIIRRELKDNWRYTFPVLKLWPSAARDLT